MPTLQTLLQSIRDNTPKLTKVSLSWQDVVDASSLVSADSLVEAFEGNTAITSLYMSNDPIGFQSIYCLPFSSLKKTLVILRLSAVNMKDDATCHLAQIFHNENNIKSLDLSHNHISPIGAEGIAEALQSDWALSRLDLRWNDIGSFGASYIAKSLQCNLYLTHLYLGYNRGIGDDGAIAIANALSLNSNNILEILDLSGNEIGIIGTQALVDAFSPSRTIQSLILHQNKEIDSASVFEQIILQSNPLMRIHSASLSPQAMRELSSEAMSKLSCRGIAKKLINDIMLQSHQEPMKPAVVLSYNPFKLPNFLDAAKQEIIDKIDSLLDTAKRTTLELKRIDRKDKLLWDFAQDQGVSSIYDPSQRDFAVREVLGCLECYISIE